MTEPSPAENTESAPARKWYQRVGPGLITACVVIGPGSIMTSSKIGMDNGYAMLWIVVVSVVFMMMFMAMGARLGVVSSKSPSDLIRDRAGQWLAVLVGICVFFISAAFQSGNNIGVASAFDPFVKAALLTDAAGAEPQYSMQPEFVVAGLVVLFNALAISFLFLFRNMYQALEKLMMVFVALMLISFAVNLMRLGPNVGEMATGLTPSWGGATAQLTNDVTDSQQTIEVDIPTRFPKVTPFMVDIDGESVSVDEVNGNVFTVTRAAGDSTASDHAISSTVRLVSDEGLLTLLGLIGTTFVITAAYYQAYLVRQKGWGEPELKDGLVDARIGSVIMALITVMLMSTTAAGIYYANPHQSVTLTDPASVAIALEPTFGTSGKLIFCLGIFAAAYSSFLVNSMIGGFILADGLGLGSKPTDKWPRIMTTVVLLTGMAIGVMAIAFKFDRTPTIIAAQAVTVIGAPLIAVVLVWLANQKDVMGSHRNSKATNAAAALGIVILLAMAYRTAFVSIPGQWKRWTAPKAAATQPVEPNDNHRLMLSRRD